MSDFLARFIPVARGPVVCDGAQVGEHDGAALYTIGQRHGLTLGASAPRGPYYVIGVDIATNTVRVSTRRDDATRPFARLTDVHWVYREPSTPCTVQVQARYHEQPVSATLEKSGGELRVTFNQRHIASPGQSLVVYDGDTCLGGGIIA